ncbi:MAG TPA: hypothetical protein VHK47_24315 [Polyangia bacterium]|nr:hypothetical protein [Polyangia bacterium]
MLEARFHPQRGGGNDFIVVAHVVWEEDEASGRPIVEPAASLTTRGTPATMLAKLQFLVTNTSPESFSRLQALKSQFWSFVEVNAPERAR